MVFGAENFPAQWFENYASLREGPKGLVEAYVSTLCCQNSCVLFRVVLSQPDCMDLNGFQFITSQVVEVIAKRHATRWAGVNVTRFVG